MRTRRELGAAKRWVVKVGSSLLTDPDCGLAPTAQRTAGPTLDDAYDRLAMLCAAAGAVRETNRWR